MAAMFKQLKKRLHPIENDQQCAELLARYAERRDVELCRAYCVRADELARTPLGLQYAQVKGTF